MDTAVHVSLVMNSDRTTKTVKVRLRETGTEREKERERVTYVEK